MDKSINIYRDSNWQLGCTFNPIRPSEEVIRTVVVNESYVKQIKESTLTHVNQLLEYFLTN